MKVRSQPSNIRETLLILFTLTICPAVHLTLLVLFIQGGFYDRSIS